MLSINSNSAISVNTPYTYLFKLLDSLGYDGWIGCEYRPARGPAAHATSDGLGWLKPWL